MRHYELMVVLSPILSAEEVAGSKDRIKVLIDQQGGTITREDQWGMRRLAYPIRKAGQTFLEGNYLLTHFATEGVLSRDLEGQLNLSEDVLRYLVVKSEPPKPVQPVADEASPAPEGVEEDAASSPVASVDQAISDDVGAGEAAVEDAPAAEAEAEADAGAAVEDSPVASVEETPIDEAAPVEDVEAAVPEADTDFPEGESAPEASIEDSEQGGEEPTNEAGSADSTPGESDDGPDGEAEEEPAENPEDGETRP